MGYLNIRSISGIYFRYKNPDTGKFQNVCFEDLPEEEQRKILESKSAEWVKELALMLSKTLKEVVESCDIQKSEGEETVP